MVNQNFEKLNLLSKEEKKILNKVAQYQGESIPGELDNAVVPIDQQTTQQINIRTEAISQWARTRSSIDDAGAADEASLIYDLAHDGSTLPWLENATNVLAEMQNDLRDGNLPYYMSEIKMRIDELQNFFGSNLRDLTDMQNISETISTTGM